MLARVEKILTEEKLDEIVELLKAVSNKKRLKTLYLLNEFKELLNQKLQLLLNTTQSVVSVQLDILCSLGLAKKKRKWKEIRKQNLIINTQYIVYSITEKGRLLAKASKLVFQKSRK
jgi:DNA-binding transcriptional ArsR family regulator